MECDRGMIRSDRDGRDLVIEVSTANANGSSGQLHQCSDGGSWLEIVTAPRLLAKLEVSRTHLKHHRAHASQRVAREDGVPKREGSEKGAIFVRTDECAVLEPSGSHQPMQVVGAIVLSGLAARWRLKSVPSPLSHLLPVRVLRGRSGEGVEHLIETEHVRLHLLHQLDQTSQIVIMRRVWVSNSLT